MKFKRYLIEEYTIHDVTVIVNHINNDCKRYLGQLEDYNIRKEEMLTSGRVIPVKVFGEKTIRKDRTPRDMPVNLHKWVDEWFHTKFGIKARSETIFCVSDGVSASNYGEPYLIFPIGEFDIIWSDKVVDLYNRAEVKHWDYDTYINNFLEFKASTYKKGHLLDALKTSNEIMLHCEKYYVLQKSNTYVLSEVLHSLRNK